MKVGGAWGRSECGSRGTVRIFCLDSPLEEVLPSRTATFNELVLVLLANACFLKDPLDPVVSCPKRLGDFLDTANNGAVGEVAPFPLVCCCEPDVGLDAWNVDVDAAA